MKVFISYSNHDRSTAEALYRDLKGAGADPFEFGQSAMADAAAFSEIIQWISQCDAFVALISANALASYAVQEEIRTANHRYINSKRTNPAKIISAILEAGVEPPLDIERFSQVKLLDYAAGRSTLFRQLSLTVQAAAVLPPAVVLPVGLDEAAEKHAQSRSAEQEQWFERASRLLGNYKDLKPDDLPKAEEAHHVDSLLADMSGKSPAPFADLEEIAPANRAFLGVERSAPARLSDELLSFDAAKSQVPLETPALLVDGETLSWNTILRATDYVVERGSGVGTLGTVGAQVYSGTDTSFTVDPDDHRFLAAQYRVKAVGGVFRPDSEWSNVVRLAAMSPFGTTRSLPPAPPGIRLTQEADLVTVQWSAVDGAHGYVLQRALRPLRHVAVDWATIYEGDATRYGDRNPFGQIRAPYAYRVKALTGLGETIWSAEVQG
jgi:TIR domain